MRRLLLHLLAGASLILCGWCLYGAGAMASQHDLLGVEMPDGRIVSVDPKTPVRTALGVAGLFALLPAGVATTVVRRHRRHLLARKRRAAEACVTCGYDLRASPDRCPECGAANIARP